MSQSSNTIIFHSKPSFLYYLLAALFPVMFFLIDNRNELFENWDNYNFDWLKKIFAFFMFFGIPVLMIIFRREIIIYNDRVEIIKPALKIKKIYLLSDMIYWRIAQFYVYRTGTQTTLTIRFKNKKLEFHKIETSSFTKLKGILESQFPEKVFKK